MTSGMALAQEGDVLGREGRLPLAGLAGVEEAVEIRRALDEGRDALLALHLVEGGEAHGPLEPVGIGRDAEEAEKAGEGRGSGSAFMSS